MNLMVLELSLRDAVAAGTSEASMTIHGTWVSYSGTAKIVLAVVLVTAAAAIAYAGVRLPLPARPPRPGKTAKTMILAAWVFAIAALLVCGAAYLAQASQKGLRTAPTITPITPVTLTGVGVVFFVIAFVQKARGWRVALGSAVIGAAAGPMIFEFPFDLIIIMARTYPVVDPGLFRVLLFGPLILVAITTLALLSLPPAVRLRRATLWCLAGMLAVYAVWGLFGFSYPSAPGPITLNAVSKILALVTALTLFLPERVQSESPEHEGQTGARRHRGQPTATG
jgi:hypothetical protein